MRSTKRLPGGLNDNVSLNGFVEPEGFQQVSIGSRFLLKWTRLVTAAYQLTAMALQAG